MMPIRRLVAAVLSLIPAMVIAQPPTQAMRMMLEDQVRAQLERAMKEQLGISDAQLARLQDVHRKTRERAQALMDEQRPIRAALRDEVTVGDTARNAIVGQLMDQLYKNQRLRLQLPGDEQQELAQFLSPLQRAKYMGIQEFINTRVNQMLQQGSDSAGVLGGRAGRGGRAQPNPVKRPPVPEDPAAQHG